MRRPRSASPKRGDTHLPRMRRRGLLLIVAIALAIAAWSQAAVPEYEGDGFTRLAHDCENDWGTDRGFGPNPQAGHNLQALDIREISKDGHDGIQFRLTMNRGWPGSPGAELGPLQLNLSMDSTNGARWTRLSTVDLVDATKLAHDDSYSAAGSSIPFRVGDGVMDPTGNSTAFYLNVTYRHETLDLFKGDQVFDVALRSLHNESNGGDLLPGGHADPVTGVPVPQSCLAQSSNKTAGGYLDARPFNLTLGPDRPVPANELPVVRWSFLPEAPRAGDTVSFVDESVDPDGSVVGWAWTFGDGGTSGIETPTHVFQSAGDYQVTLNVTDDGGGWNETSKTITVHAPAGGGNGGGGGSTGTGTGGSTGNNAPPVASFSYAPAAPRVGDPVAFQDTSSDSDGTVVAWVWTFGDGEATSNRNTTHVYRASGNYAVKLTVTDDDGSMSLHIITLRVAPAVVGPTNPAPQTDFSWDPILPLRLETIQFRDHSTDDGEVVAWHWDFGNGASSTQQHPRYAYPDAGDFTVSLRTTDDQGASHVLQQAIPIMDPYADRRGVDDAPRAEFTFAPTRAQTGQPVRFQDLSVDDEGIVAWAWEFGDGARSSVPSPTHRYASEGLYTVALTVSDSADQTHRASASIVVDAPVFRPAPADEASGARLLPGPSVGLLAGALGLGLVIVLARRGPDSGRP